MTTHGLKNLAQPWQFIKPDNTFGICAWCQKEQGVKASAGESHGICPRHTELMHADLFRMRAKAIQMQEVAA
jgi:hypothetical protein